MKRVSNLITSLLCGVVIGITLTISVSATTAGLYSSKGRIVFDNGTTETSDDVVFDASDFDAIDSVVTQGKESVASAINTATGLIVPQTSGTYTFSDITNTLGTITNRGKVTKSLNAGESYTIPAGYHNGSGKVTANSLASQTAGTAKAEDITKGSTAWVGGTKLTGIGYGNVSKEQVLSGKTFSSTGGKQTGTMVNNGGKTVTATTVTESGSNALITIPANAYYSTSSKLSVPIETIKKNIDIGKPEFAYDPVYKGNYNSNVHTISVNKDKYYMAVFKDANGAGRCNISKLTIDNVTITKSMGDSTNNVAIFWFKTNGTTITVSGTTDAVAVFFVSELSNNPEYVKEFTSITYVARGFDHQTFTVPCSNYAMIISMGYQGTQSLSMTITEESYSQEGFKAIKSYATHSGYNNCGYAHLICKSDVDFEVILSQLNNFLILLS